MSQQKLTKNLGLFEVYCLATGAMVSSGIFILPGIAHAQAGPSVILSYILAGLLAAIGMLNACELATAMPKAGGDYYFITRSLGPVLGSIAGLLNWFALSLKSAFALVGMGAFVLLLVNIDIRITATTLGIVFTLLNLWGTRHAGKFQTWLVTALLTLMTAYVIFGISHVEIKNLSPFIPFGLNKTLAAAGLVFVAYGGLLKISSVAEEIENPSRNLPRGMILSLASVITIYGLMVFVTTGVLPSDILDNSLTPITEGARSFLPPWAVKIMSLAAIFAFISTANAGIMASSRYLFALSRDELLPKFLSRINPKTKTPAPAVIATGIFVIIAGFLKLNILVEAASLVLILSFILSCLCVIVLRESRVQNYRPTFKTPFYPFLQIIGLLGYLLLIFELGLEAFIICACLCLIGATCYFIYGRKRLRKEYALLHLIERITDRELVTGLFETELKNVVRDRDNIILDRFDEIIARCPVMDLPAAMTSQECFEMLGKKLSPAFNMPSQELAQRFIERENQATTVLNHFLAIPHIIIRGENQFEIALVRSSHGIHFSDTAPDIHAVFVLAGSKDQRTFHLHTLAAIAQIVHNENFENQWLNAPSEQALRDVILLGKRQRTTPTP